MSIEYIHNVPASRVDAVRNSRIDAGGTVIQIQPEGDGEFTLVVIYPDSGATNMASIRVFSPQG